METPADVDKKFLEVAEFLRKMTAAPPPSESPSTPLSSNTSTMSPEGVERFNIVHAEYEKMLKHVLDASTDSEDEEMEIEEVDVVEEEIPVPSNVAALSQGLASGGESTGERRNDENEDDDPVVNGWKPRFPPLTKDPSWPQTTYEQDFRSICLFKYPTQTTEYELRDHFEQFGTIEDIRMKTGIFRVTMIRFRKVKTVNQLADSVQTMKNSQTPITVISWLARPR